ncbi:hypothetical protein BC938DRAFT_474156, partial [Jimgerdemannia flammicorona]
RDKIIDHAKAGKRKLNFNEGGEDEARGVEPKIQNEEDDNASVNNVGKVPASRAAERNKSKEDPTVSDRMHDGRNSYRQIFDADGPRQSSASDLLTSFLLDIPSQDGDGKDDDSQSASDNEELGDLEHAIVDLTQIAKELQQEPLSEWVVDDVNVTQIFRRYQKEALVKASTRGLTWNDLYELLALSSIIVLQSPCPYPVFTNRQWRKIMGESPYLNSWPVLPVEISSSLKEGSTDFLEGKNAYLSGTDSDMSRTTARIFNDTDFLPSPPTFKRCSGLPAVSPRCSSEEEHCFQLLYPIIRPFFVGDDKEYKLRLNRATRGTTKRPDLACLINEIPVLNSEIKPLGVTPFKQSKDKSKVHLRARKAINQLLETKGGPTESAILINAGDLIESYIMDLKYDGLYRSWAFLTTRLVTDRTTIPLLESNIRHFVALERALRFPPILFRDPRFTIYFPFPPFSLNFAKGTRQRNSRELQKQERQLHPATGDEIQAGFTRHTTY